MWDGGEASGKPLDYSNIQVLGICGEKELKLLSIWLDEADGILPPSARQILKKGAPPARYGILLCYKENAATACA